MLVLVDERFGLVPREYLSHICLVALAVRQLKPTAHAVMARGARIRAYWAALALVVAEAIRTPATVLLATSSRTVSPGLTALAGPFTPA